MLRKTFFLLLPILVLLTAWPVAAHILQPATTHATIPHRNNTNTINETRFTANDVASIDQFGSVVAIDGDTAAVLSINGCSNPNPTRCGAIYVYTYNAPTWTQQAKLTITSTSAISNITAIESIAIDDDTIVAGVATEDCAAQLDCGAIFVFSKPAAGWITTSTATAKLTPSSPQQHLHLGAVVDIDGNTVVAGSQRECASGQRLRCSLRFHKTRRNVDRHDANGNINCG